jgi:hypothetical protein
MKQTKFSKENFLASVFWQDVSLGGKVFEAEDF